MCQSKILVVLNMHLQACTQDFLRAGEVSANRHKFLAVLKVKCQHKVSFFQLQFNNTRFFKQHFDKQCQAEIGKKIKQKLSNTLRLTF